MKKLIIIVGLIVLVGLGFWFAGRDGGNSSRDNENIYNDTEIGFSFEIPGGVERYVAQEPSVSGIPDVLKAVILINAVDFADLQQQSEEGREGPPTINILSFSNEVGLTPAQWAQASGVNAETIENITVGEREAIMFPNDGLYASRNVVVTAHGVLYFISGSYIDTNSDIYRDFESMLDTLMFDPEVMVSGSVTAIEKTDPDTAPVVVTIATERGSEEKIYIPAGGVTQCESGQISDPDQFVVGDLLDVKGERTLNGVMPCNSVHHFLDVRS